LKQASIKIPASSAYGVYAPQLIRYSIACAQNSDVLYRTQLLTQKLIKQGCAANRETDNIKHKAQNKNTTLKSKENVCDTDLTKTGVELESSQKARVPASYKTPCLLMFIFLVPITFAGIYGVMISMFASNVVDRVFETRSGQTKDNTVGMCCFSAKHEVLRIKNKHRVTYDRSVVFSGYSGFLHQ
jgi:hypothetical protein